jgi:S-adenosylmethionine synthetase
MRIISFKWLLLQLCLIYNSKQFFGMKKVFTGVFAAAVLMLSSCGEKLLTPEQVQAEITKGFEAGKAAVEQEATAACDAEFENRVTAETQRMIEDARTNAEQQ